MKRFKYLLIVILSCLFLNAVAQSSETGIPQFRNFTPATYKQESQNFSIVQDKNSVMYFGNSNGIMEYDNERWTIVGVPGKPKLSINSKNEIYFGGYNKIGRVCHKNNKIDIEEFENTTDTAFGQIGKVIALDDDIYFATTDKLFLYKNGKVLKVIDNEQFLIFNVNEKVYVCKENSSLQRLDGSKFVIDDLCNNLSSLKIKDIVYISADSLIIRDKTQFYTFFNKTLSPLRTSVDDYICDNVYECAKCFGKESLVVGTRFGGVLSISLSGNFLYGLNTINGLRDNLVSDIYIDDQNKTWLATDNGITLMETNSKLSIFNSSLGITGTVLSILRYNSILYVGTTDGLYFYRKDNLSKMKFWQFNRIKGIKDNCWQLKTYKDNLYAVTNDGIFRIDEYKANLVLSGSYQVMEVMSYLGSGARLMLGSADGLTIATINGNKMDTIGTLRNMPYKVRTIVEDFDGNVWMGTDSDGLFKVNFNRKFDLDASVLRFNQYSGLPQDFDWIDVSFDSNLGPLFSSSKGVYRYDYHRNFFVRDTINFPGLDVLKKSIYNPIKEDINHNIWYSCANEGMYEREVGVMLFDNQKKSYVRYITDFGQMKESVIETIYPETDEIIWFGTTDALLKYDKHLELNPKGENAFKCMISKILVATDSIIYSYNGTVYNDSLQVPMEIKYEEKKIRFEFAGLAYNTFGETEYQFMLKGFDDDWSEWTTESYKEYTTLKEAEYAFLVRSRNGYGQLSNIAEFSFEITPPYYRTTWAYALYALLFILFCVIILTLKNIAHVRERCRLEKLVEIRTNELVLQKEQTENLVKKLLPQNAADELRETGKAKSEKYEMVTVLFSDIQGFTKIAAVTNPEELIKYLNEIFVAFDNIISKYNIEKIKTIGDAYMCAGGMPNRDETNPVEVVLAGLEMQRVMAKMNEENELKLNIRVGIHTGPVVAGVVGSQKIEYDIWGDTVNIASRMESHGEIGKVNISEETYRHVKSFFLCQYRGKMDVKHVDEIEMYFVNSIYRDLTVNEDMITPNLQFNVKKQSLNYELIQEEIMAQMQRDLPKNLYYHNLKHTTDAIYKVVDIGTKENVSEEDLLLLKCAALFHDSGFMVSYDNNEESGANLALQTLEKYKFTPAQIDVVRAIIMSTKVPQSPKTLLEEIMCDADLDYLGRPDFIPISQNLYRELYERGKIDTIDQWNKMQYKFVLNHKYFTETAKRSGEPGKQQVLKSLKELI